LRNWADMNSFVSKPLEHAGNWTVIQIRYPNGAFKDFSFTADSIDKRNLGYVWAHDFNIGMSYNWYCNRPRRLGLCFLG
jgi:hypothetical protein